MSYEKSILDKIKLITIKNAYNKNILNNFFKIIRTDYLLILSSSICYMIILNLNRLNNQIAIYEEEKIQKTE